MGASEPGGEGAIIVPVEVPIPIRRLRDRMDPSAAQGAPAHVTLIYPFMAPDALDDSVRAEIGRIVRSEPVFPFTLARVARWPDVVYLVPEPEEPFSRLIAALTAAFPDFPPYGGAHEIVVPHLTVAQDPRPEYLAAAEHALPAMLPIRDIAREAWLIAHTAAEPWHTKWRLPLGDAGTTSGPRPVAAAR